MGTSPYGPDEVSATLGVEVRSVIAWDPRTASVISGARGAVGDLRRSPLVRSAATLTDRLATEPAVSDGSEGPDGPAPDGEVDVAEEVSG